jgi:hypothetical protein
MNDQQWEAKVRAEFEAMARSRWPDMSFARTGWGDGYDVPHVYNMWTGYVARAEQDKVATEDAQAEIDRLMLEFCPAEMTGEQIARWEAAQVPASTEDTAAIDAALAGVAKK